MIDAALIRSDAVLLFDQLGSGPAALLLHAGGERRRVWHKVMEPLARRGFLTVAYDQRGHGESGGGRDTPLTTFGADTAAMIGRLTSPIVVGASLGGFAALSALADPNVQENVAGLVLVDVVPDPDPVHARTFLDSDGLPRDRAFLVEDILGGATSLRAAAASLALPVLLIRAGLRSALTDEDADRLLKLVPHATIAMIAGAGHLVARDKPLELAQAIGDFLLQDAVRDRRIDLFLTRSGAHAHPHPGGTLARHLHRTAETLRSWGASPALVDAGRLHAAYGTDGFQAALADGTARKTIIAVAGREAEAIIDCYCRCDRVRSYPTWHSDMPVLIDRSTGGPEPLSHTMRLALMELTVANELDVLKHDPEIAARFGVPLLRLFARWRPFLGSHAQAAISQAD
ncbi:alpha/beta fold hydrolase [Sphingomonas sp.]|uniref:alpha/beta fold hydrolase n=1 Tax=Sphingomonas sp. TaxID=28214 RepID=UPI003D6D5F89